MMISDEEKRWLVVGIAMNSVAAPVLRDAVKQGMDTNYTDLDRHCQHLSPPRTLKTLNHGLVRADPIFAGLKFGNINNNQNLYGKRYSSYNFNISDSIDLAKLYLPGYLAQFSAFNESLDMTAILRLLGRRSYMPAAVFSPHTQASADDVRENVRNKWGHVDVTEWTDTLYNDCFDKLKKLIRSLGLTTCLEKTALDHLDGWQTKGCELLMGHAVDKDLLHLVQDEVRDLMKEYHIIKSHLNIQNKHVTKVEEDVATLRDLELRQETRLDEHHQRLDVLDETLLVATENSGEQVLKVLERLVSFEAQISMQLQSVEKGLAKAVDEVELLKQSFPEILAKVNQMNQSQTETAVNVELLKQKHTQTVARVEDLDQRCTKADDKVEEIRLGLKTLKAENDISEESFDLNSCRIKLEDHYKKTATVPTSVWCKKSVVDIHQIYTRLSWVKEEQTPAGATQSELKHYSELFKAKKNGVIPKRILVQGQTGIGKSTFVKKLLVDWIEVNNGTGDEQAAVLKNFELVVAVNLKEVSKCKSLKDVIRLSNVFAKEDKYMTEGLVDYISNNQEKVLLVFDGYDEYRSGCNSEIYEIFRGSSLRNCRVLITTRISKADELRGGEDLHTEITGFSEVDREDFMRRLLRDDEALNLENHLYKRHLDELSKVPLLLLFFCILWRKGQLKSFPKSKTKLYLDIVQFILNHSYSKQTAGETKTSPHYVELKSFENVLSEIGKVALQSLLKDDHFFEYSQLSDSVRCDESMFIGLLQITEYSETLRPVGMVSFIHKSIQEFLAAWYVTYRCIPEGGNLGEIGVKLEECLALENVFQFICGLSEDGALAALRHLKSVRISDPSLDLSKAVPDVENETDVPLSDITERQDKLSDLVLNLFEEVESKDLLSSTCLDCLGNVLLFSERPLPDEILLKAKEANSLSLVSGKKDIYLEYPTVSVSALNEVIKLLVTERSEILQVSEFLEKFLSINNYCGCGFFSVLSFRNGQVYFYITHLALSCKDHVRLFTYNVVPPHSAPLPSGQLCLKFLKTLECSRFKYSMKRLGAVIKHCYHLERVEIFESKNPLFCLLEQVPNPRRCSLSIRFCGLSSIGAVKLTPLLPRFETVTNLDLDLAKCSARAATLLVNAIKHKSLEELELSGICLRSAGAGHSLPESSVLRTLKLSFLPQCPDGAVTGLLADIKHKTLEELELNNIHLTSSVAEVLCHSLPQLLALQRLAISGLAECSDEAVTRLVAAVMHKTLVDLKIREINLTPAVVEALGHSLPKLSALQQLEISGSDKCSFVLSFKDTSLYYVTISGLTECVSEAVTRLVSDIKRKTVEHLQISEINLTSAVVKTLGQWLPEASALLTVRISGLTKFSDEALARLVATITHKTLFALELTEINITSAVAEALSQSLPELSALEALTVSGLAKCSNEAVTRLIAAITHNTLLHLELNEINMTSAVAEALSQSLPELSALETLKMSGLTEYSDEAVTRLLAAIKHKTLEKLDLSNINLTLAAAKVLGESLPDLSALQTLVISSSTGCGVQLQFPNNSEQLGRMTISGLTGFSAAAVTRSVAAIKNKSLDDLELRKIHVTSAGAEVLGQSLHELSALQKLTISSLAECSDDAVTRLVAAIKHKALNLLALNDIDITSSVAEALGQSLPELSGLQILVIEGSDKSSLQLEKMEALFGRLDIPLSLEILRINCFSARGSLSPLTKRMCFFPYLKELDLAELDMGEDDLCDVLESLKLSPDLQFLCLSGNPLGHAVRLMGPYLLELQNLKTVTLSSGDCSHADWYHVAMTVKEKRPQLKIVVWNF